MTDTPVFVTLEQLAKRLNLPKAWLHREAIAGRIPSIKAGPVRRFNVAAVAEAINAKGKP
jgi:excisionase family DNA binding protein